MRHLELSINIGRAETGEARWTAREEILGGLKQDTVLGAVGVRTAEAMAGVGSATRPGQGALHAHNQLEMGRRRLRRVPEVWTLHLPSQ
jgi:hypothetical protein